MGELTPASVKKLKVAELRSELSKLGLDTKGNKPVLVQRLLEAISDAKEDNIETNEDSAGATTTEEESQDESAQESEPLKEEENEKPEEESTPVASTVAEETVEEPKVVEQSTVEPKVQQEPTKEETMPVNDTEMASEESKPTSEETKNEVPETDAKETQETSKEEPMDQTPAVQTTTETTTSPVKDEDKPKEVVDHDTSVDFSKVEEEPEVELDDSLVVLDKYTSDLFIKVSPEALSCGTLKEECFLYMAGGVRATWGVKSGKICFEVKVTELHEVQLPDTEEPKNSIRVGWSVEAANLQLGEDSHSYGYDNSGKKCHNSEFTDFGEAFGKDDVITCYLDLESEVKKMSFSKNGEDVGEAFELSEDVKDTVFFPHVSIKNADCSLNFGSQDEAWFAPKEGFAFIQNVSDELKVHGVRGPANKSDCEVLMMIGLPASGKTTWVKKYIEENPDKHFNVLGTNEVLDKMKLMGVARKQETSGYNKHMDKAAKCLHRLFEIAPSKKRNYILDQTNVYTSAQSKKMRPFEGYQKKAIVCIPSQSTLKERMDERKNEGTELPYNAICDMKRNFSLPKAGDLFNEVTYVDQDEENSKTIVAEYIKEVGPPRSRYSSGGYEPDHKRPRYDDRSRHRGYGGSGGWSGGSNRDHRRYDDRRGGYRNPQYNRRGNSPHYGSNRGGYRDNYRGGRGGYQGGGYHDRNRQGGGNRSYGGGKSYSSGGSYGGSSGNQHRQQYNYNSGNQQSSSYSPQQSSYGNYQYYQQQGYQQYGQQQQQQQSQQSTAQGYQQYPAYYQQGTYQQGGYGYGY